MRLTVLITELLCMVQRLKETFQQFVINALDRYGDSAPELAASRGHEEAAKFLIENGASRIRGDAVQREKAIRDQLQEDIESLGPRKRFRLFIFSLKPAAPPN
jgi:hypothetical protein